MVIKKGDIVIVNLNPTKGSEQRGIRPAIIFQTDKANKVSPHTIIPEFDSCKSKRLY